MKIRGVGGKRSVIRGVSGVWNVYKRGGWWVVRGGKWCVVRGGKWCVVDFVQLVRHAYTEQYL